MKKSNIYTATNLLNGKRYIGQSINPIVRIKRHISGESKCCAINNAIKRYGKENFQWEVLESDIPVEQIDNKEMFWIKELKSKVPYGYNLTDGGKATNGIAEETREKLRIAAIGNKRGLGNKSGLGKKLPESHKKKISESNMGRIVTEETRKKISEKLVQMGHMLGKKLSDETKDKIRKSRIGRKHTDAAKLKVSIARKGKPNGRLDTKLSEETKRKMSLTKQGKVFSEEHKKKLSESHKGKPLTEEHKKNISKALALRQCRND